MTTRTIERTVTFMRPFAIGKGSETYPPGKYLVQTDEEMIPDVSFTAWRRIVTMIHLRSNGAMQALIIDPAELESSLARDAAEATSV
jgi:hypothetical protein